MPHHHHQQQYRQPPPQHGAPRPPYYVPYMMPPPDQQQQQWQQWQQQPQQWPQQYQYPPGQYPQQYYPNNAAAAATGAIPSSAARGQQNAARRSNEGDLSSSPPSEPVMTDKGGGKRGGRGKSKRKGPMFLQAPPQIYRYPNALQQLPAVDRLQLIPPWLRWKPHNPNDYTLEGIIEEADENLGVSQMGALLIAGDESEAEEDDSENTLRQSPSKDSNAKLVARLLRAVPGASPHDAQKALQDSQMNFHQAHCQLLDIMTEKQALKVQAQQICNQTIYDVFPAEAAQSSFPDWLKSQAMNNTVAAAMALQPILDDTGKQKPTGRMKALLIGCSYRGTRQQLDGPLNDLRRLRTFLTSVLGFPDKSRNIVVLSESDENMQNPSRSIYLPTKANIFAALEWLASETRPGDALFFYYSGHGSQKASRDGYLYESDGMDETILPMDYKTRGHIRDDDLADHFARRVPAGVRAICMLDCCHSGTGLDLPYNCDLGTGRWRYKKQKFDFPGDVTLIAGCQPDQTSADLTIDGSKSGGAMSMAFLSALSLKPFDHTFKSLLKTMAASLRSRGLTQVISISSSIEFPLTRPFKFNDIVCANN